MPRHEPSAFPADDDTNVGKGGARPDRGNEHDKPPTEPLGWPIMAAEAYRNLAGDIVKDPTPLGLGGDTGLRGYPRNYQTGDRRVVFNVEERVYTDWYPFRLIRVGGAVFFDSGRAWDGPGESLSSAHWLSNVGFGLRFLSTRSSFGNVLHVDLAFPLNRDPNIKSFQFLVQTKLSL